MGKSLKGKELGKGISQRKDGLYQARFINRFGKRQYPEPGLKRFTPHCLRYNKNTRRNKVLWKSRKMYL